MRKRTPTKSIPKTDRNSASSLVTAPQRQRRRRILDLRRTSTRAMIETGRELVAAQAELKRTTFWRWVDEVGMSKREAAPYMRVAEMVTTVFGDRCDALEALSITALEKLSGPKVPKSVRMEVLHRVEADEPLRSDEVLKMVRDAIKVERMRLRAEREEERLAQLSPEQRDEQNTDRTVADAARPEPDHPNQDEVERAAADVIDRIGVDVLASLAEQLGEAAGAAFSLAVGLAVSQNHRQDELIELSVSEIEMPASEIELSVSEIACTTHPDLDEGEGQVSGDDTVLDIATRIEAGDPVPPISVAENYGGGYDLTDGHLTYKAYTDVLERPTVPVLVVPPIEITLVADRGRSV